MLIKKLYKGFLYCLPHQIAHSMIFYRRHGKRGNFKTPSTYDEKIHWLILNYYDDKYAKYADKILVRDYVRECGLSNILIPLAGKGVYDQLTLQDFEDMPNKFILKANHASGEEYYYICKDKSTLDYNEAIHKINDSLHHNYAHKDCEYHYRTIKRRIICEELLESDEERMTDYKVICSYGKVIAILVCTNREEGRDYYSPNWEYLNYTMDKYHSSTLTEKPKKLKEMLNYASILGKPFPLARVDFYYTNDTIYFGEITLTPSGGNHENLTMKGQIELGKRIQLPE